MFPLAGQTAGPNGLKFFEDTIEYKNPKCRSSSTS